MVPQHLDSICQLLRRAFPCGLSDLEYVAVLEQLYPHMADENLAIVMADITARHVGVVLNDIYAVGAGSVVQSEVRASVSERLRECGFDVWAKDEG